MARTVDEIKQQMAAAFMGSAKLQELYGFAAGATFASRFSSASLEGLLLYIVAYAMWVVEKLLDVHRAEVDAELLKMMPHTARWYREKVLRFQYPNRQLIADTDRYDNEGLSEDDVAGLEVVKFCAVTDKLDKLQVKVAKGEPGSRAKLDKDEVEALTYYLTEIRDAGVKIEVVNQQADRLTMTATIYYNPLALKPDEKPVEMAVKDYISNMEFNGSLSYTRLVDRIQAVPGVELVDVQSVMTQRASFDPVPLGVQKFAESGYWVVDAGNSAALQITYTPYKEEDL
jgi:hypothetical protein